jgi:Zn-dependent peptidase ImmA (M78 family)/transcriptional regulator with XRE-family HTH domain
VGVSPQALSQFELGHAAPSASVLAGIIRTLNMPLGYFLRPAEQRATPVTATFFRSLKSATRTAREMLSVRADWLEDIFRYLDQYIRFPPVDVALEDFTAHPGEALDGQFMEDAAISLRRAWGLGLGPIGNVTLLLEKHGIVITRTDVGAAGLDACSQWRGVRPFIYLTADKESAVRSRFDAAHELAHLLFHMWVDTERLADPAILNRIESEAHRFAGAFLLPAESFSEEVVSFSLEHLKMLKIRWKVSMAAMIHRCSDIGILPDSRADYLWKQMARKRYRTHEPFDDDIPFEEPVLMQRSIRMLLENGIRTGPEIIDDIRLPAAEIEGLCGLAPGALSGSGQVISLDFRRRR